MLGIDNHTDIASRYRGASAGHCAKPPGFELDALKGQGIRQAQLELTEHLPGKQTTRAPQESVHGNARLPKSRGSFPAAARNECFHSSIFTGHLAELNRADFCQGFARQPE